MPQFSVYINENRASRKTYPYFLDVQTNLLDELNSRLVIPLTPSDSLENINVKKLCPLITIGGKSFALLTHQLTAIPASNLKQEVENIEYFRNEIVGAIDLLITGI